MLWFWGSSRPKLEASSFQVLTGARDDEASVLHTPEAQHLISHALEIAGSALHDDHFQAVVVI